MAYWDSPVSGGYSLRVMATFISSDVANNRSRVRFEQWLIVQSGRFMSNIACSTQGYISGQTPLNYSGPISVSGPENRQLANSEVWINHNADGTGSVVVSGFFEAPGYVPQLSVVNQTMALPTIPRATTPTLSPSPVLAGSALTISLPRASAAFVHDVSWKFGTASGVIATAAGTGVSWTPPLSLLSEIPNATAGTLTITAVTKNGSTTVGTRSAAVSLQAPTSVVPVVGGITYSEATSGLAALVGAYVQGRSTLALAMTGVDGAYGSTIVSASLAVAGQVLAGQSATSAVVATSGSVPIVATVTDSRGRSGSVTVNVPVLAYELPKITSTQLRRAIAAGTPSESGTYLRADLTMAVASLLVGGVQKNTMSYVVRAKLRANPSYVTKATVTPAGVTFSGNNLTSGYLAGSSYDVQVTLTDALGQSVTVQGVLAAEGAPLHVGDVGIGAGKIHEQGSVDAADDMFSKGNRVLTVADLAPLLVAQVPIGGAVEFGGSTAPTGWLLCNGAAVSRTTYAALFAVIGTSFGPGNGTDTFNLPRAGRFTVSRDPGQTEFDTVGEIGGAKTHTQTVAQMPAHGHGVGYVQQSGGPAGGLAAWSNLNPANLATQGNGQAMPILPPYEVWNRIIRAS